MANKYEKIDFGTGQNTPTGDTIHDGFQKVNKAFDEIEYDIANIDVDIDLSDYAKNEDLQEFENETNQKISDLESDIEDSLVLEKATNRGIYLKNRDESKYAPIGVTAIDLSISNSGDGWLIGAKTYAVAIGTEAGAGNNSVAIGNFVSNINAQHAVAIGSYIQNYNNNYSVSIGHRASAGENSIAIGNQATSVNKGIAIGETAKAFGLKSVSFGDTLSNAAYCLTIGRYNNRGGQQTAWSNGSEIFIVGNGTSESNRSNAYTLFNNGTSTQYGVASYGADYSANFTANSLVSKKYVDDKITNIDVDVDLTNYYIKSEIDTKLNTVGQKTLNATVIGQNSSAGQNSRVFGSNSTAKKDSVIIGNSIVPTVDNVITIGNGLIAKHSGQIIIGEYNIAEADEETTSWNTNNLLTIANGSSTMRKNAYTMDRSGNSVQYGIARYSADFSYFFDQYSLVSKKYVDEKVANVNVDLSNLYTKQQTDNLLAMRPLFNDVYTKAQSYGKTEVYNKVEIDNKLSELGQTDLTQAGVYPNQQTRIGQGANTTHQWSSAFGFGAKANNQLSTVLGGGSEAYRNSVTVGCMNYALTDSVVIGNELGASVDNVILVGVGLFPQHRGEIIIGRFNKIADNQVNVLNPTNNLFTIANGSNVSNRSNAYELFNNGSSIQYGIASYSDDFSANFTENSLVSKKYVDSKLMADFVVDEETTEMDKVTLNSIYGDKNVGFVLYCINVEMQTKFFKLTQTEWAVENYFLAN